MHAQTCPRGLVGEDVGMQVVGGVVPHWRGSPQEKKEQLSSGSHLPHPVTTGLDRATELQSPACCFRLQLPQGRCSGTQAGPRPAPCLSSPQFPPPLR